MNVEVLTFRPSAAAQSICSEVKTFPNSARRFSITGVNINWFQVTSQ